MSPRRGSIARGVRILGRLREIRVSDPGQVPEGLGTILDAHIHTVRGAADSSLQPDDLLEEARRIGLTGINISEHDRV